MPCTDIINQEKNAGLQITKSTCSNPHEDETCSPFCICFCCGSLAINSTILPEITLAEFSQPKKFKNTVVKTKNISFSIWQPPKTA